MRRRALTIAALICLAAGVCSQEAAFAALVAGPPGASPAIALKSKNKGGKKGKRRADHPWGRRMKAAKRFARRRAGAVSFAVVDARGRIHGFNRGARYSSASLVKAMLMVAYLRQARGRRLNGGDRALLGPMITVSDNGAADSVMGRVGTGGLARVGRRAGMRRFILHPVWGGSQVTARDQALFFFRLPSLIPERHRSYGLGLLRRIAPAGAGASPRAHRSASGSTSSLAVLTEGEPGSPTTRRRSGASPGAF